MEKQSNVPVLRFPGFEGEWKREKLADIGISIIDGDRGVNYPNGDDFSGEGYCLFMNAKNVTKNGFSFVEKSFITKEKDEKLRKGKLRMFDIVLTTRGSVGHIAYYDKNVPFSHLRINSGMVLIRTTEDTIYTDYLYRYFNSNQIQKEIDTLSFGSAQPQLTVGEIAKFKVCFPSNREQQKIATFLTSVDEKLQALKKKKSLLEQYKKGVMQKIFLQALRFRDENGEEFPDWVEKRFGELYSFKTTNSLSRDKLNYTNGSVKNIHYGDIHTKFDVLFDIENETVPFINDDIFLDRIGFENYCKEGDLIIADASEDYSDIGKCVEIINLRDEKVLAGLHTFLARPNYQAILGFGGYMMKSEKIKSQLMFIAQGTKVLSISSSRLSEIKVQLPNILEQAKIVGFLTEVDKKINSCKTQVGMLESWKRGILQKMFV